ncbi:MAG: DinB family protein [Candidatus Thorarchaeota archaeon]
MKFQPPMDLRTGLSAAYKAARDHFRYLLTDLTPEQAAMEAAPESRTIIYYLVHIANSELYWLSASGRKVIVYAKEVPLNIAIDLLDEVQDRILRELKECSDEELVFQPPTEKQKPSLGWVIAHITLHTIYHSAEIIYTRYAVGGSDLPNEDIEASWGRMMDAILHLIFFVKQ